MSRGKRHDGAGLTCQGDLAAVSPKYRHRKPGRCGRSSAAIRCRLPTPGHNQGQGDHEILHTSSSVPRMKGVRATSTKLPFVREHVCDRDGQATWLVSLSKGASQLRDSTGFKPASLLRPQEGPVWRPISRAYGQISPRCPSCGIPYTPGMPVLKAAAVLLLVIILLWLRRAGGATRSHPWKPFDPTEGN